MFNALRQSVVALLLAAVAGCGQMGPLYLPVEAPEGQEEAAEAATAQAAKPDDEEG